MSTRNRQALEYLQVRGYYSTGYTQIVQPERIFAATDYFRRYWVPLLKPGPAWLVVALRQRCYWNGQRDWCVVSRETLAQECGIAVRTVDNYLDLPLIDWFVTGRQARYRSTPDGARQRDWTHYDLRLDEPLTPGHQAGLAALAVGLAAECRAASPTARALEIAHHLLDLPPDELWQHLEAGAATAPRGGPRSVQQIIEEAAQIGGEAGCPANPPGAGLDLALSQACDALTSRLVRPEEVIIASQYFRLSWLPLLGAARAWLVLHLRSRCYLNARKLEVRDRCTVAGLGELAAALGVSLSTVKTCLAEPPAAAFFERLSTHRPALGQVEIKFRVEMIDPLTPADQQRYAGLFDEPAGRTPQQPDSAPSSADQQPDFALSPVDQQPDPAHSPPPQQPDSAALPDQRPDFAAGPSGQQPETAPIDGPANSQILQDTRILVTPSPLGRTQQPQVLIRADAEHLPLAAAAGPEIDLLTALHIEEPSRSRIMALKPSPEVILAWAIEAQAQNRIERKAGFLVSVLQAGHTPPAALLSLVRLTVAQWREMARAVRQTRTAGWADLPAGLAPHFEALSQAGLAGIDPAGWPFLLPDLAEVPQPGGPALEAAPDEDECHEDLLAAQAWWAAALDALRWQMDPATFAAWLKDSRVIGVDGRQWTIGVGSPAAADWLGHRLARLIGRAVERIAGEEIEIRFQ